MFLALIGISDICLLILYFTVFYKERKKEIPFVLYLLGFIVIESFSIFNLLNFLNIYSFKIVIPIIKDFCLHIEQFKYIFHNKDNIKFIYKYIIHFYTVILLYCITLIKTFHINKLPYFSWCNRGIVSKFYFTSSSAYHTD